MTHVIFEQPRVVQRGETQKLQSNRALLLAQQLKLFQHCSFPCTMTSNVDLCPSIYSRRIISLQKTLGEQVIHSWCFFCCQTKRRFMSQKSFTKPLIPSLTKCLNLEVPLSSVQSKKSILFPSCYECPERILKQDSVLAEANLTALPETLTDDRTA